MNRTRAVVTLLLLVVSAPARGEDCFAPFLTDRPPEIVETISKEVDDGVEVTRLKFLSRIVPGSGQKVIIYAVMARPVRPGPHPAVLVCHGGGGYADMVASQVVGWARRGYVSICQDQPGFCNVRKARSSGPCLEAGAGTFKIVDKPTDSSLFDGVAAALGSLALLRSQPDVDKSRVGVFGGSWGGYMTTMVTGLAGRRVKASFSVYGCGYFDVGSAWTHTLAAMDDAPRRIWLENLDAGRRAANLTAAHFVPSPANDWFFWPSAVMRTLADIPGEKNYCFMPNDSHSLRQPGGMSGPPKVDYRLNRTYMEIVWLEYHLAGRGKPFPTAKAVAVPRREANALRVQFQVEGPEPITKATVWYAAGEVPWRMKWWAPAPATLVADSQRRYTALVPVEEPDEPIDWFAVVTDRRNVSVSTLIRSIDPKSLGFRAEGYPVARFRQDFEDTAEHRRWRRRYADLSPGRHAICTRAAHGGKYGLELKGQGTFACWGIRGATLRRSGTAKLRFWMRAAEKSSPLPAVELQAERPDGRRVLWRWQPDAKESLDTSWRAVDVPLAAFKYAGADKPPFAMLSPALGQLRFVTSEKTCVWIDDIEALGGAAGDEFPRELIGFVPYKANPVFAGTGRDTWDHNIRERGYILREGDAWHLWYTGYNPDRSKTMSLGYATSPDGLKWTRHADNPIFDKSWVEDMCVVKHGDTYYMFAEGLNDIAHMLTSTDRVHWRDHGSLDIRDTTGKPLSPGPYGTPTVWIEGDAWHLFYERGDLGVWLARSQDRKVWTNVRDEPVIARGPESYDKSAVALNQVIKHQGKYYGVYHANADPKWKGPWTTCLAVSTDLIHWKKYPKNPIIRTNDSSGIFVHDGQKLRLYTMHPEVKVWLPRKP